MFTGTRKDVSCLVTKLVIYTYYEEEVTHQESGAG